ncbi:MAG: hypothetical protein AAF652_01335 [Cyanobacteria bacterium P01_C01_bin.72]
MNKRIQTKLSWQKALGALVIFSGTIGGMESLPAGAASVPNQDSRDSSDVALLEGVQEHTLDRNLSFADGSSLIIANDHYHHGRRHSRGFVRKRFGRRHRRGRRFHGRHRRHHGHHGRFGGFRKFKKIF